MEEDWPRGLSDVAAEVEGEDEVEVAMPWPLLEVVAGEDAWSADEDGFVETVSVVLVRVLDGTSLARAKLLELSVVDVVGCVEPVLDGAGLSEMGSGSSECTTVGVLTEGSDLTGVGSIDVKRVVVSLDRVLLLVGVLPSEVVVVMPPVK